VELSDWIDWWKQRGKNGLNDLLLRDWDPIGVGEMPEARDEYASYAGQIGQRLREGAETSQVADYLSEARVGHMEAGPDREADTRVAGHIVDWYREEEAAWTRS